MENIKEVYYKDHFMLCNFENGAVVLVDEDSKTAVKEYLKVQEKSEKLNIHHTLEKIGFYNEKDSRKQVYLHVTHRCNMDCVGCYSRISNRNLKKDLSLEKIIEILDELEKKEYTNIVISGGEPMLRKDIHRIIEEAKKRNMNTVMITNGSVPVSSLVYENLDALAISIDEMEKENNSLGRRVYKDRIIKIIQEASKHHTEVSGIVTLNRSNIDEFEKYHKLSGEYEIPLTYSLFYSNEKESKDFLVTDEQLIRFTDRSFYEFPYTMEGFSPIEEIFCKDNCGAGYKSISVDGEGNLSPCHMMHDIKCGNLLEDSGNAWARLEQFKENLDREKNQCENCDKYSFCGRGCIARSHAVGGTCKKDPYCKLYDTYFEKQFDLLFR